uniref:Uncharacterized protein n=1 Tax=viral metagenome TaxID=1070528 RepID=A0A2V0RHT7_9ZZZZ
MSNVYAHSDKFYDPKDLAEGSFGTSVDKYLGRSPFDGPSGYVFRKIQYTASADASKTNLAGIYKTGVLHRGHIYHDAENGTENIINEDQAGGGGITGESKLQPGDIVLGAILQIIDGRGADNRTGIITGGLVANDSSSPDTYGPEISNQNGTFVIGSAISGAKSMSAGEKMMSVCTPNLDIYNSPRISTLSGDLGPQDVAAPLLAINVSGCTGSFSSQIRFVLHVYALCGARQKAVSAYKEPDMEFSLSCLTKKVAPHPVSIV